MYQCTFLLDHADFFLCALLSCNRCEQYSICFHKLLEKKERILCSGCVVWWVRVCLLWCIYTHACVVSVGVLVCVASNQHSGKHFSKISDFFFQTASSYRSALILFFLQHCTDRCTHTHTHTRTYAPTCACTYTHTCTHILSLSHTHTHSGCRLVWMCRGLKEMAHDMI